MILKTYSVNINSINFSQRYEYDDELLTALANTLYVYRGNMIPLIVERIGKKYFLLEGEIILLALLKVYKMDYKLDMAKIYVQKDGQELTQDDLIKNIEYTYDIMSECTEDDDEDFLMNLEYIAEERQELATQINLIESIEKTKTPLLAIL